MSQRKEGRERRWGEEIERERERGRDREKDRDRERERENMHRLDHWI